MAKSNIEEVMLFIILILGETRYLIPHRNQSNLSPGNQTQTSNC